MPKHAVYFVTWYQLPGSLPVDEGGAALLVGRDSVSALTWKGRVAVFVRSMQVSSNLYWSTGVAKSFTPWQDLGGNLATDATVVYNPFSGYMEAYAVLSDGKVNRKDQVHDNKWHDWTVLGVSQPAMVNTSRPVAHAMSETIFHGMTEVFALGADGKIKHIWQTTCDNVVNPWGYCTWGLWGNIAGSLSNDIRAAYGYGMEKPQPRGQVNVIATGHNVHLGNEVFFVGKNGSLWHVWQLLRNDVWNGPDLIGRPAEGEIGSLPTITQDRTGGWWRAYVITTKGEVGRLTHSPSALSSVVALLQGIKHAYTLMLCFEAKDVIIAGDGRKLDPVAVVDAMEHALCATRPRSRYVVGWDAWLVFVPISWLPTDLGDLVLRVLSPKITPACCRKDGE
uniref:PLL-like beta propeller domain-containing protein n=1 Tax=Branchiostoma floridae TaxID=7739 RepID=C3YIL7_BRAFL|eukprot:XP_002603730.1 hypothetical protein BRAFLDRAFT_97460 [Branchiostoma floridae]